MHCCKEMEHHLQSNEVAIVYVDKFREYGIKVLDGGSSFIEINHRPWCGRKLPDGLRDKWFVQLDELGLEPGSPEIPEEYLTDKWWRSKNC